MAQTMFYNIYKNITISFAKAEMMNIQKGASFLRLKAPNMLKLDEKFVLNNMHGPVLHY